MDPFIGEIRAVGFNFAPRNWAMCNGQILSISENSALYALLGTFYGGDGRTTLGLPDLRGRSAIGFGDSPSLPYTPTLPIGQNYGTSTNYVSSVNLPSQSSQTIYANAQVPAGISVSGEVDTGGRDPSPLLNGLTSENKAITVNLTDTPTAGGSGVNVMGAFSGEGSVPIGNCQPSLAINYIIALQGIFPSRN